jgi:hypothetical protein
MRSRILVGVFAVLALLGSGVLAASDAGGAPSQKWVAVYFQNPTSIAGAIVQGTVMILHDDELMAKGGECTQVYRFDKSKGPKELVVSFMCTPTQHQVVDKFTATCERGSGNVDQLIAYQFPGDTEQHAVPR